MLYVWIIYLIHMYRHTLILLKHCADQQLEPKLFLFLLSENRTLSQEMTVFLGFFLNQMMYFEKKFHCVKEETLALMRHLCV